MNRDGTTVEAAAEERGIRKPSWEEGPADLRLVPLAVAAWVAAACAVGVAGWWTLTGVVVCVLGAAVLLTLGLGPVVRRGVRRGRCGRPGRRGWCGPCGWCG